MRKIQKINVKTLFSKSMKKVAKKLKIIDDKFPPSKNLFDSRKKYNKQMHFWNKSAPKMKRNSIYKIRLNGNLIKVKFFYPKGQKSNIATLFIHGGGFIVGGLKSHDYFARIMAKLTKSPVILIDYTLAPKAKFPSALRECRDFLVYLNKNAKKHKINNKFISLLGDSSGANMAMGLALMENRAIKINSLLLFYGVYTSFLAPSRYLFSGFDDGCDIKSMKYYEKMYLKTKAQKKNPLYNIINAKFKSDFPPCYLAVGDLDPLLDDSKLLYMILRKNQIKSKIKILKGHTHCFGSYCKKLPKARRIMRKMAKFKLKMDFQD